MKCDEPAVEWSFRLYYSGRNRGLGGIAEALRKFLDSRVPGYTLELVDIYENPIRAETDRIVAVPCLVRIHPEPMRTVIGDFSKHERMEHVLDVPKEIT